LQVSFSHSGHLFVASNPSTTLVFNTYTLATVGTLRGHTAAVRSVCWSANDQQLVTVGMDGAVYEWKMDTCSRDQSTENVLKSVQVRAYAMIEKWAAAREKGHSVSRDEHERCFQTLRDRSSLIFFKVTFVLKRVNSFQRSHGTATSCVISHQQEKFLLQWRPVLTCILQ
jgi:WD40 repeat protein